MKMTGAEITIRLLERQGIQLIAGIPGGQNLPLYDALFHSKIRHILTRHEQGAGFIAQGIARSTGKPAVCFATSGPGVTNLLTAIADAKLDSIPIIAITGQVSTALIGTDAFQEVDTYGISLPITKHNFFVQSAKKLFDIIPAAFRIAMEGRPGPILIDIPKSVQAEMIEFKEWPKPPIEAMEKEINQKDKEKAALLINKAQKPLILIGGGAVHSKTHKKILELAKKNSLPIASTLMGIGCVPMDDPLYIGMLGMHGARYTNYLLDKADLLIALGVRFDDRATGNAEKFCRHADILHIDIDHSEIDKIKRTNSFIAADLNLALNGIFPLIEENKREKWLSEIACLKKQFPPWAPKQNEVFHPLNMIQLISQLIQPDAIITTDVGQHQMWTAQAFPFKRPRQFLTSGGLGTMGFGLPAAIGAALAWPDRQIICISGDGSILMNIQELATLADHQLNVKIIILNNGHLGLVRQQQELFYEKKYIASEFISQPDFTKIGEGFGIKSFDVKQNSHFKRRFKKALDFKGPALINVPIDSRHNVLPMIPPGGSITEMIGD
jgi:acetolactate synthase-1/2/3 large subunit